MLGFGYENHEVTEVLLQYNETISLEHPADDRADIAQPSLHSAPAFSSGIVSDYSLSLKRDPSIYEHETQFEHKSHNLDSHFMEILDLEVYVQLDLAELLLL